MLAMNQLDNFTIRPLKKSDSLLLNSWGSFNDSLFYGYEYNDLSEREKEIWYRVKTKTNFCQYYSVIMDDGHLLGYVGIKEINYINKSSKLGIVIDPNFVSQGYGKKILNNFLDIYFNLKKYKTLELEVNSWNYRAIKLYESLGFKYKSERYQKFENQDLDIEKIDDFEKNFNIIRNDIYSKVLKMSLKREEFINESRIRK